MSNGGRQVPVLQWPPSSIIPKQAAHPSKLHISTPRPDIRGLCQGQASWDENAGLALHVLFDPMSAWVWVIRVCSWITLGLLQDCSSMLPDCSRHALPCSGYNPGCSGSQKRRLVGPKTEREGVEDSTEMSYNRARVELHSCLLGASISYLDVVGKAVERHKDCGTISTIRTPAASPWLIFPASTVYHISSPTSHEAK